MTKIAYLHTVARTLYIFKLSSMKALVREGCEVYAIVPLGAAFDQFKDHGIKTIEYKINRKSLNPFKALKTIFELYMILKREKFTILHSFNIKPNVYGTIAGKLAGIPIIINGVEGLGYIYIESDIKTRIIRFFASILYKITFTIADKVIFSNPDDMDNFKNLINTKKAIIIKGCGIDADAFSEINIDVPRVSGLREEIGIGKEMIVITFTARLIREKGVEELITAANTLTKKYNNLIFLIVGSVDKENPTAITEEFILKAAANTRIKFLGERDEIREMLALTAIYVLPSYREGASKAILEAMAMAKPVITTNAPGCRQMVENGITGFLVPVKNSKALEDAMERLILDKALREKMGSLGREKAVHEFSEHIIMPQILDLYNGLLATLKPGVIGRLSPRR